MAILYAILASALYSLIFYVKKLVTEPTPFSVSKFIATILVGAGIGAYFHFRHIELNENGILAMLSTLAGTVVIVENVLKVIYRLIFKRKSANPA